MPFIAKTAPVTVGTDDIVRIEEKAFYGGQNIRSDDLVYLWSSETRGGVGLWGRGTVVSVQPNTGKPVVTVRVDQRVNTNNFGLEQIAPHRDSTADTPIAGLARKLYKHSLNKVAYLSDAEAALLQQQFG
ncbi:MAG: hypothetical protein GW798_14995 [Roseovarius sp.]|nr:hypothetical protein [Roseovarius sp.]